MEVLYHQQSLIIHQASSISQSKKFVIAVLDADSKTFVVHVTIRKQEKMPVHSKKQAQVKAILFDETLTAVPTKYSDYSDIFLAENVAKLSENTGINKYAIKLEKNKQPLFGAIYNLGPIELETFKTYIETNLANNFICLSKSLAGAPIQFDRKPNRSFRLCVDYWGFNNISMKNQYPLPLICKSLD